MADAGACAHDPHIASLCPADITETVLMGDGAAPDIGDDLHIRMSMHGEAAARSKLIVFPDPQRAERRVLGISHPGEGEVQPRLEPVTPGSSEAFKTAMFDHGCAPVQRSLPKQARSSATNSSGCSKAAKCPPLGSSLQ